MTGDEFKDRLRRLGRTQIELAREIGVSRRSVHHWAERGPPAYVVYVLSLIERCGRPSEPPSTETLSHTDPGFILDTLLEQAEAAQGGATFVKAVERWLAAIRSESAYATSVDPSTGGRG